MKRISELSKMLRENFTWNKSRLECFLGMVVGLCIAQTVNMKKVAVHMPGTRKQTHRYRRIKLFFQHFTPDYAQIASWVLKLFLTKDKKVYLAIDRTNWYFGKKKINAFVLSIAHEGVAIPIYWELLNKAGNSKAVEQIELIKWFVDHFGKGHIEAVLGDREFANKPFFSWLIKHKINFYIRVKENPHIQAFKSSKHSNLKNLFRNVHNKKQNYYPYSIFIRQQRVFVAAGRSEKGELMIIVTNADPKHAVPVYMRRWKLNAYFKL